jgi:hypothetical protein
MSGFGISKLGGTGGGIVSSDLVYFDKLTPTTSGVIFSPNTPETIGLLYISSVDASVWIWDGVEYISYSNDAIVLATTYSDFYNSITTSQLDINKKYLITDFQTIYDQPDFSAIGTPKAVVSTLTGATEPIIVTPVAVDEISNVALSTVYPNDSILYDWTFTATEVMGVAAKGRITQRTDTSNNTVSYDSRNVLFKRYDDGLGNYTIYWDNGNASNSAIPTFNDISTSYNNYFVNTPPTMVDATNSGFLLNNTVFLSTDSFNVRAGFNFYNNTFENFSDSNFGDYCYDNIIFGSDNFGNTIGDNFWRNTIEGNFQRNTIESGFFNNTIQSGFRNNTTDKDFYDNTIGGGFRFNTIGIGFRQNTILTNFVANKIRITFGFNNIGTGFENNVIGDSFFTNTIGNNFNNNKVSNDFSYSTIGNNAQHNIIGFNFYNNTVGVNFESNNIGEYFAENTIGDDFSYNNVAYSFAYNIVGDTAQNNTIADEFMNNTIGLEFQLNNVGQYCFSNTILDYFLSNTIGEVFQNNNIAANFEGNFIENDFTNNTTLGNCKYNKIGYDSSINTLGAGFWNNTIKNAFNDNTIGSNFQRNNIGYSFQTNVIGTGAYDNEINNYFNNNTVGFSFEKNNIGEYFYQNTVGDNVNNLFIQNLYNNETIASSTNTETNISGLATGFVKNTDGVLQDIPFGAASQYVRGDGTLASFPDVAGGGGGQVYYCNGGTSEGTIGGNAFYQLSTAAVIGSGVDFTSGTVDNVAFANFITDIGKPTQETIPAGVWIFQCYMSASASSTCEVYATVEVYNGSSFTVLATSLHEVITNNSTIDLYTFTCAVPEYTPLTTSDRIAIRFYPTNLSGGKTITLHTQDSHLSSIQTTFTTGIASIDGLTATAQYLQTGTTGTDFNITTSGTDTHVFNLPTASATNRGALSSADWNTFNGKISGTGTTNYVSKFTASGTIGNSLVYDNGTNVGIGTTSPSTKLDVKGTATFGSSLTFPSVTIGDATDTFSTKYSIISTNTHSDFAYGNNLAIDTSHQLYVVNSHPTLSGSAIVLGGNNSTNGTNTISFFAKAQAAAVANTIVPLSSADMVIKEGGNVGIGTTTPDAKLYVSGSVKIVDGTQGAGKVLTSDANGLATWSSAAGGTVTSVAALTLGTTGTDLSSTVANSTTTPVITLNVPTASATNRGALSSTDWSTFNGKQNAITLTTTGTSGAATLVGSTLNIPQYAGGLTYFTEAQSTASPNATVNVDSLTAVASTTNADFAIIPKGTGAIIAAIPDGTSTGGNKRGANAVDLQTTRNHPTYVASGSQSAVLGGYGNKATGSNDTTLGGYFNTASGSYSVASGFSNTASGSGSFAGGQSSTASNTTDFAFGNTCTISAGGYYSNVCMGYQNTINNGLASTVFGAQNQATWYYSFLAGNNHRATGFYGSTITGVSGIDNGYSRNVFARNGWVRGDNQSSKILLNGRTTDATPKVLVIDNLALSATSQITLNDNNSIRFKGSIIARQSGSTNTSAWDIDGIIQRGTSAATTTLLISNVNVVQNTPAWGTPILTANTTLGCLTVTVTGAATTNIQWTCSLDTTEVIYA